MTWDGSSIATTPPARRVDPWGYELISAVTERYGGRRMFDRAAQALGHERKDETHCLDDGMAEVDVGADADSLSTMLVRPGVAFRLRAGRVHGLRAIRDSVFLEVPTPELEASSGSRTGEAGSESTVEEELWQNDSEK